MDYFSTCCRYWWAWRGLSIRRRNIFVEMELRLEGRKMRLMIVVTMTSMASMTMTRVVRGWS